MSVASEYHRADQVVADVALLHDMAAGRLDEQRVREAARLLLEHRRHELPSVSIAVAARLLEVSRTTVEAWRQAGVLTPASTQRRRHEVTIDSLVRVQALLGELRQLGKDRELRDYVLVDRSGHRRLRRRPASRGAAPVARGGTRRRVRAFG